MSTPFLGEIKIIAGNTAPNGWAFCNGQLLPINQNQALFSLLGTIYGGDGNSTFGLPDLRGRAPVHAHGGGTTLGEKGGEFAHTLTIQELPTHNHVVNASDQSGVLISPSNNTWAVTTQNPYASTFDSTMNPATISNNGGSQAHNNTQPFLVLNFIIALQGIFPSQN